MGVAVVGTGFGCVTHVRALRAAGFSVAALVGRDSAKTAERAEQFGVANAYTRLSEAFSAGDIDAVTIATPPHTHGPLVLEALAAGKHVLCEKPFARDAAEARELLAAAEAAGVVHLLGTEFRWDPGQATLARAVAAGVVGEPRLALVLMHVPMLAEADAEVPAWWADAGAGGGWFGAHGSQVIDQVRVTLGEFDGVSAALPHVAGREQSAEDAFVVHFRMRSGCTGVLSSTCGDLGPFLIETRVVGSKGTAWIQDVGDQVFVADADGTRQLPLADDLPRLPTGGPEPLPPGVLHTAYDQMIAHGLDLPPYTRLAETFRDLILGNPIPAEPQPATFADGVAQMQVLDAVRRSAATKEWVKL
ncbi:MAG: Gfo/Idh/MocA family oxidoreductase [Acidimicrobiia bacterium]|nr:Gfo/Idh/MocA family oxidoreductase [Acidimicrobiia bacterium]